MKCLFLVFFLPSFAFAQGESRPQRPMPVDTNEFKSERGSVHDFDAESYYSASDAIRAARARVARQASEICLSGRGRVIGKITVQFYQFQRPERCLGLQYVRGLCHPAKQYSGYGATGRFTCL